MKINKRFMKKFALSNLFFSMLGISSVEERLLKIIDHLKNQLGVLDEVLREQNSRLKFNDQQRKRLAESGIELCPEDRRAFTSLVKEHTLMKWYRLLVKKAWTYPKNHKGGQGVLKERTKELIIRMATANIWGFRRITGELRKLDIIVSYSTVRRFMIEQGFDPNPLIRIKHWVKFLKRHIHVWQVDFTTCPVVTIAGVKSCYLLFFLNVHTRKVIFAGSTYNPTEEWVNNKARDLSGFDGELENAQVLVHDNDTIFTERFDAFFEYNDTKVIKTAFMASNMNASVERFHRTIKEEALNDFILFSQRQLNIVVNEYLQYYHKHRPHQGLGNELIEADELYSQKNGDAEVIEGSFLGGHLNYYHRKVA